MEEWGSKGEKGEQITTMTTFTTQDLQALSIIATICSFIGVFLNAKKNIYCWYFWSGANILWIVYTILTRQYPQTALWVGFTIANVYGYKEWKKSERKRYKL